MPRANRYLLPGYIWHSVRGCRVAERYRIIDQTDLLSLCHVSNNGEPQALHRDAIQKGKMKARDERWTQSVAIGPRRRLNMSMKHLVTCVVCGRALKQMRDGC